MEIIRIFVSHDSENGLWSIREKGIQNEFEKFFETISDVEWLHQFFSENESDLNSGFFGKMSLDDAVMKTLEEVEEMEETLYDFTEQGFTGVGRNLQHFFQPLNNYEYAIARYQKSKARLRKGWLRLYAVRLAENCFVVTGGAIKLTQNMQQHHLQNELRKLEQTKTFLRYNGIHYPDDLNTYQYEQNQ